MLVVAQNSDFTNKDIENVIEKFNYFLNILHLGTYNIDENSIEVVFSNERIKTRYNDNLLNIKKRIIAEFNLDYRLKKWLKGIKSINQLNAEKNDLVGCISNTAGIDRELVQEKFKEIMHNSVAIKSKRDKYLLGKYNGKEEKLVLYSNTIKACTSKKLSLNMLYEEVFIHELFHAYHYYLCSQAKNQYFHPAEIYFRKDYTMNVIKESLASYFEKAYCDFYNIPTDIYLDWENFPSNYPYAGAKYITDNFNDILEKSTVDFDSALRMLLQSDIYEFFNVKNVTLTLKSHNSKDYSKYSLDKKVYAKNRFALAVVNKYVNDNPKEKDLPKISNLNNS